MSTSEHQRAYAAANRDKSKAYMRARGRALTRLVRMFHEDYLDLLDDELKVEGLPPPLARRHAGYKP